MSDHSDIIEKLESVHDFPGPFVFKVIGPNEPSFIASVAQSVINTIGPNAAPDIRTRESSAGNHLSVTITVEIPHAEVVLDVYAILKTIDGVKYLL